jgi:hypothetical protein
MCLSGWKEQAVSKKKKKKKKKNCRSGQAAERSDLSCPAPLGASLRQTPGRTPLAPCTYLHISARATLPSPPLPPFPSLPSQSNAPGAPGARSRLGGVLVAAVFVVTEGSIGRPLKCLGVPWALLKPLCRGRGRVSSKLQTLDLQGGKSVPTNALLCSALPQHRIDKE